MSISTIVLQDIHAGRKTDSVERVLIKTAALSNIAEFIQQIHNKTNDRVRIVFNGDISHAAKENEFDVATARLILQPLIDICVQYSIPITPILGNWDIARTQAAATDWQNYLLESIQASTATSKDQLDLQIPEVFSTIHGDTYTHGHLSQPSMGTVLKALVSPRLARFSSIPYSISTLQRHVDWAVHNSMQADEAAHKKADFILAIQEWVCSNSLFGAIGKKARSALDNALAGCSASIAERQYKHEGSDTIFIGHTHSVHASGTVINVGTTGADMRPIATFGYIDNNGRSNVMSAWHPSYPTSVMPYAEVKNIPISPKLLDRSYVLHTES